MKFGGKQFLRLLPFLILVLRCQARLDVSWGNTYFALVLSDMGRTAMTSHRSSTVACLTASFSTQILRTVRKQCGEFWLNNLQHKAI
eukprot:3585978-Amphidinium_carterae.1